MRSMSQNPIFPSHMYDIIWGIYNEVVNTFTMPWFPLTPTNTLFYSILMRLILDYIYKVKAGD